MIKRKQYMAYLKQEYAGENLTAILMNTLSEDRNTIENIVRNKECMTVALHRYENMLFLYYEDIGTEHSPYDMFSALSQYLEKIPSKEEYSKWLPMNIIYYNAIPDTVESWSRIGEKERIGRLAYILPDKLMSYLYYHKKLLDEGLLEGERYLSIGLYDTILFHYSESPQIITHLNSESNKESSVCAQWRAQNPKSHFDHTFSGEGNFVDLQKIFSLGREEIFNEQCV